MTNLVSHTWSGTDAADNNRIASVALFAVVTVVSLLLNLRLGTGTDVTWIITIIERMLDGDRLYTDIMEVNPPFSIWLYYPIISGSSGLPIDPETAVAVYAYVTAFFGLGLTAYIATRHKLAGLRFRWWIWPLFLAVLVVLPGGVFAQREHFGIMLFMPLLALMAARLQNEPKVAISPFVAVVAGLAGSIIVLVKPHWALAVFLPAIHIAWTKRSFRPLLAAEFITIGVVAVAYLTAVLVHYPEFFQSMYPMLKQLYLPIRNGSNAWPGIFALFALTLSPWLLLRARGAKFALADIAGLASIGFFVAMFFLGKGWIYHLYPSSATGLIASILSLQKLKNPAIASTIIRLACIAMTVLAVTRTGLANHASGQAENALVAAVRNHIEKPKLAVIGADIGLGFPFVRQVGGIWQSAYCSDWAGAYALHRLSDTSTPQSPGDRLWLETFLADFVAAKADEFNAIEPDIVIVTRSGPWIEHLSGVPAFSRIMDQYETLGQNDRVMIWRRKPAEEIQATLSNQSRIRSY